MLSNNSDITIWQLCFHILVWSWAVENVKCFTFRAGPISFTFVFSPFSNLLYIRYSNYCWTVHYTIQCLKTHITIQPVSVGIRFYFVSAETNSIPYYPVRLGACYRVWSVDTIDIDDSDSVCMSGIILLQLG